MEKTIRIFGKELSKQDGKKFVVYSYMNKNGEFFKVKFRQDCENAPRKSGYIKITVNENDVNIKKGVKEINGKKENSTLWVKNVIKAELDKEYSEKVEKEKRKQVSAILDDIGGDVDTENDLPY